tara:strand:+ start:1882 stop:2970 length:1089 start_codon:yes stop_codon:yes gene_type:complete
MTKKIKYGIIGTGLMGCEHISNLNLIDEAEVIAICDTNKDSLVNATSLIKNNIEVSSNYNNFFNNQDIDAYVIATPNFTHHEIVNLAIKTKKHLLIEKPLCSKLEDCIELKKISKEYNSIIWVAMEYRFMPPIQKMLEEINKNRIGKLQMISIREHRFPFLKKVDDWNRFQINTGGTLVEKCCHFFDLMRLITNSEATQVYASGSQSVNHLDEKYNDKIPDIIDNAFVTVDFKNHIRASLELCMFAENSEMQEELCAIGNKGKIETGVPSNSSGINSSNVRIGLRNSENSINEKVEVDKNILAAGQHHGSTYYQHLEFIKAIKNNLLPQVSLEDGLLAVAIGEAAELSIKENRVIKMKELNL